MRIILALQSLFCVAAAVTASRAEEPVVSLPDLVVTATRVPTKLADLPAGVTIIDRRTIEANGYNTLAEAIVGVPGLHPSVSGGPGGQASVFIRGTNSNHVLVLRDGMPINDAADASGAFNFGVDTLSDIERIEIVRGPMAAVYGSSAIGGVINLISRRGSAEGPHLLVDLSGGYPQQVRGSVTAQGVQGPVDYAATVESQSQRGYDAVPQRQTAYTGTPQGFRDRIATVNLGYTPVEGTRFSVFLRGREALFGFNALGSPTFDTANSSGDATSLLGRVGVTSLLFDRLLETSLFLGRLQEDRRYVELLDARDPNLAASDSRYHAYRTDLQWNNTLNLPTARQPEILSATALTFGYAHTVDTARVRVSQSFGGFPFAQSSNASMTTDAVHGGVQTTVAEQLTLTAQVRQDWVEANRPTTWRIGAVEQVPALSSRVSVAYGTAFRAASLFDRFGVDTFGYTGNPNLQPERAEGWEAGFVTDLKLGGRTDAVSFGATYFDQRVRNLIVAVFSPQDTAINIGAAHVRGVETEVTLRPAWWLTIHGSWTFTDTDAAGQADTAGAALARRPRHSAEADLTITPMQGLRIVPSVTFTGAARDYLYDNAGNGLGYGVGQHGTIARVTVTYDVRPSVQLYARGSNIFGSRFEPVNGYQTPGPVAIAGIRLGL